MRPSKFRHPLAILRQILGIRQKELADMAECSVSTIQSIELRRLNLSEELAQRISEATAVGADWLLQGDPKVEPWDKYDGFSYRKWSMKVPILLKIYLEHFGKKEATKHARGYVPRLAAMILKAARSGRFRLVEWQIDNALRQIEERYEAPGQSARKARGKK